MVDELQIDSYRVPVRFKPDICIIGGGTAGLSAAIAAARTGRSVLIIEKYGFCGGAAVAGLSGTICGLHSSGSNPEQIVFGFANEFYQALRLKNGVTEPVKFGKTLLVPHDSLVWKETADRLLHVNNCRILFHTNFLSAFTDTEGRINGVLVKGPEGQFAIKAKFVIDASGDAEVVNSVSGTSFMGNNGMVQTPTMIFKMANVNMQAFFELNPEEIYQKVVDCDTAGTYKLPRHHVYIFPLPNAGEVLCNMTRITYPDGSVPLGVFSADLTYAEIEGRKQAREYARFLKEQFKAFQHAYMVDTGVQVGIRQTRSIVGKSMLKNSDVIGAVKSKDAVTLSAWPIEMHGTSGVKVNYLEDDYYDIPLNTLVPEKAINLLVAGRCMCAEHEALASARVTAQCFNMGYAIGAAAGLILTEKLPLAKLNGLMLKEWMKEKQLKNAYEA